MDDGCLKFPVFQTLFQPWCLNDNALAMKTLVRANKWKSTLEKMIVVKDGFHFCKAENKTILHKYAACEICGPTFSLSEILRLWKIKKGEELSFCHQSLSGRCPCSFSEHIFFLGLHFWAHTSLLRNCNHSPENKVEKIFA